MSRAISRSSLRPLDRRLPGVERAGEVAIARDAVALRAKAVQRLAELLDAKRVARSPLSGKLQSFSHPHPGATRWGREQLSSRTGAAGPSPPSLQNLLALSKAAS